MSVCVCVRACVRARVRTCLHVCMRVCVQTLKGREAGAALLLGLSLIGVFPDGWTNTAGSSSGPNVGAQDILLHDAAQRPVGAPLLEVTVRASSKISGLSPC